VRARVVTPYNSPKAVAVASAAGMSLTVTVLEAGATQTLPAVEV